MAEKEQIIRERFANSGLFDFKSFYNFAHSFLLEEKYGVVEDRYTEKVSGDKRDMEILWVATRFFSDYFKVEIKIRLQIDGMTEVEVEMDGVKKKMNKGSIRGDIKGLLVKDPDSVWEMNPINRFMRDVYNKYVIPVRVLNMEQRVKRDVTLFKDEMKAFLDLSGQR
jgi:hypothetical protein